jgi:excisionase family DNA binding protein
MDIERLPRLNTKSEAAAQLRVEPVTIYREIRRGRLACTKVGGKVFVTDEQIAEYLARNTRPCRSAAEKSPASGSASTPTAARGAAHGSTHEPDRHAAAALARATFSKPGSG